MEASQPASRLLGRANVHCQVKSTVLSKVDSPLHEQLQYNYGSSKQAASAGGSELQLWLGRLCPYDTSVRWGRRLGSPLGHAKWMLVDQDSCQEADEVSTPKIDWIKSITSIKLWVLFGVFLTSSCVLLLHQVEFKWFKNLTEEYALIISIICILSFCMLTCKITDKAVINLKERKRKRIRVKFKNLSNNQQEFLINQFKRGTRAFAINSGQTQNRWFEELKEWKYIKYSSRLAIVVGDPNSYYEITVRGWAKVKKWTEAQEKS